MLDENEEEVKAETEKYIESQKETFGGEDAFNTALENAGMTLDEYKEKLNKNMKDSLIGAKVTEEIFKDLMNPIFPSLNLFLFLSLFS